ncbi:MAG: slipin family protein [Candidatus Latescibacteria bacterium]|jgi:regulator of protease activity HflC (stomatin/prohibitin superfamily)|nr:slipin family protein [Candidatus Latescibacterota bacterium]
MDLLSMWPGATLLILLAVLILANAIRILREYERGVIFRLGRLIGEKGPGLILLIPLVDRMVRVSLRVIAHDVPPQEVVTRDNVAIKVNAVLYFRVIRAPDAIVRVEDYFQATSQMAQTTLRSIVGEHELDDLLADRERINQQLQRVIDDRTDPWGIKVSAVEVKDVDLPQEMLRAIARQAEAERERRAKVIHAEGEFQASQQLTEAARVMGQSPSSMLLRYLQSLIEISTNQASTVVFPVPIDLLQSFVEREQT